MKTKNIWLTAMVLLSAIGLRAQNIIYDSGSPVSHPGINFDTSYVQNLTLGLTTLGWSHQNGFRVSDEFEIVNPITLDSVAFYMQSSNASTTSQITSYTLQIWDGNPSDGTSTIVWGDSTTNVLSSTSFANAYRMVESAPSLNRPIMRSFVDVGGLQLNAGTYWLDWDCTNSASTAFAVPITIAGESNTGNALIFNPNNDAWSPILDLGINTTQGLPFQIYGSQVESSDLGIVAISQPTSGLLTSSESVTVRVANFGANSVDGIPISVKINDGAVTNEMIAVSIPGGDSLDYTFTNTFDLSNSGNYTITAWVSFPDDVDYSNDTLSVNVSNTLSLSNFVSSSFSIFPNPVADQLEVESDDIVSVLRLTDQSGRVLHQEQPNAKVCKVSIQTLPAGIYILELMVNGVWHNQRLVKE